MRSNGFYCGSRSTPGFFGCLYEVPLRKFILGLLDEALAEFRIPPVGCGF